MFRRREMADCAVCPKRDCVFWEDQAARGVVFGQLGLQRQKGVPYAETRF